jgi:hypothetical protein
MEKKLKREQRKLSRRALLAKIKVPIYLKLKLSKKNAK